MRKRLIKIVDSILRELLRPISRGVIVTIAGYTTVWGIWVANPFWHVFQHAPLYAGLDSVAPEWFWGWLAIVTGLLSVFTAVHRRVKFITPHASAALLGYHWLLVGILYLYGDWQNTGGITCLFIALLCGYIYLNVHQNDGFR